MPFSLDPELARAMAPMAEAAANTTPPAIGDVGNRRGFWESTLSQINGARPMPDDVTATDHVITTAGGSALTMRWYAKDGVNPGAAVVFFHGGGYIWGTLDIFDQPVAAYVSRSGVPMLSVDYRRAPEHPYPAALDDADTALSWLHAHAAELGVDPRRIAVMGDSAGGGLAACLAIRARDRGGPAIASQILMMPMLDDREKTPDPFVTPYAVWTVEDGITAWRALLGDAANGQDVPATAAPARLADAAGLPPAYIEVGQIDVFRDEDLAYATTLSRAGVPVEFHLHPGVPHEFDGIAPESDVARRAMDDRVRVLRSL